MNSLGYCGWFVGAVTELTNKANTFFVQEDKFIEFGRPPMWNCPMPESEDEGVPSVAPIAPGRQHTHEHTHKHREPARPESVSDIIYLISSVVCYFGIPTKPGSDVISVRLQLC